MKMSDIKVGMKVKVKSAEKLCRENNKDKVNYVFNFNTSGGMNKYCGKTTRVLKVFSSRVRLVTDEGKWSWHPDALELPNKKISFKEIL